MLPSERLMALGLARTDTTDVCLHFVGGFTSMDPIADIAEPFGVFDLADINAFVNAFAAGCP